MARDFPLIRLCRHVLSGLTDEAIASTMCGFNEAGRRWVIVESLADLTNGDFKDGFTDKRPWPDSVEQFLFCDELARTPDEMVEHGEGFGAELYCLRALPQTLVGQIQAKGVEDDLFSILHSGHRRLAKL